MIRIRHRFHEGIVREHAPAPRQLAAWSRPLSNRFLAAAAKMDAVRPEAARDLLSDMDNNPALERVMGELRGRERTTQLVAVLRDEHRISQDPNLRAERLVTFWNRLEHEHARTNEWGRGRMGCALAWKHA